MTRKKHKTSTRARTINAGKNTEKLIQKYHRLAQNLFYSSDGFPKDNDVFAQTVSSRNTSSRRRGFASSSKQGGVPEIARKTSNTSNIQNRRAIFKHEQTEIKTRYQEKLFCCAG
jgi:methionyl-tRNA synthetase